MLIWKRVLGRIYSMILSLINIYIISLNMCLMVWVYLFVVVFLKIDVIKESYLMDIRRVLCKDISDIIILVDSGVCNYDG